MRAFIGVPPDWSEIQTEWRPPIRRGIYAQPLDLATEHPWNQGHLEPIPESRQEDSEN